MTLLAYQVFQTVVEQGSFYKAATILNLTPSAVSHSISPLEQELGFPVFNRNKNGVTLTNYGESLAPLIRNVLHSDESLQQAIAQFNGLQKGAVTIGCFSSVCTNWIPEIVHSFHQIYPNITIQIYQGTYDDVTEWLKNGTVDIGFLSVSSAKDLPIKPLYKDPLLCVAPKKFTIKDKFAISLAEMKEQTFVSQRESCDADIQNYLQKYKLNVHSSCRVTDDLSTIAMVANGFGICIMPELVMKNIPYPVNIYKLDPAEYRIIGISCLRPDAMAPAVKMMYQHIEKLFSTELTK